MMNYKIILIFFFVLPFNIKAQRSCSTQAETEILLLKHNVFLIHDSILIDKQYDCKRRIGIDNQITKINNRYSIKGIDSIANPIDFFIATHLIDTTKVKFDTINLHFPLKAYFDFNSGYLDLFSLFCYSKIYDIFNEPIKNNWNNISNDAFFNVLVMTDSMSVLYKVFSNNIVIRKQIIGNFINYPKNKSFQKDSLVLDNDTYSRFEKLIYKAKVYKKVSDIRAKQIYTYKDIVLFDINLNGYYLLDYYLYFLKRDKGLKELNKAKQFLDEIFETKYITNHK